MRETKPALAFLEKPARRLLALVCAALLLLSAGIGAAEVNTAGGVPQVGLESTALQAVVTNGDSHHPCDRESTQHGHPGCISGGASCNLAGTQEDAFVSFNCASSNASPEATQRLSGRETAPPFHPPKLSVRT